MNPRNASEVGQRRYYSLPGGDRRVTSVTTYLKMYPQEWMGPWAAKMVALRAVGSIGDLVSLAVQDAEQAIAWLKKAPWEKRDASADVGSHLHTYLELRMRGALPASESRWIIPGEQAIDQFIDTYRPEPLFIEAQIGNPIYDYAGSLDLIARIYGRVGLIDLKTGTISAKDRLQLAAYRHGKYIFEDDAILAPVPPVDFCAVLHVPKDDPTSWQLIEVEAGAEEFDQFLGLVDTFRWYEKNKDGIGGTLILPQVEGEAA